VTAVVSAGRRTSMTDELFEQSVLFQLKKNRLLWV